MLKKLTIDLLKKSKATEFNKNKNIIFNTCDEYVFYGKITNEDALNDINNNLEEKIPLKNFLETNLESEDLSKNINAKTICSMTKKDIKIYQKIFSKNDIYHKFLSHINYNFEQKRLEITNGKMLFIKQMSDNPNFDNLENLLIPLPPVIDDCTIKYDENKNIFVFIYDDFIYYLKYCTNDSFPIVENVLYSQIQAPHTVIENIDLSLIKENKKILTEYKDYSIIEFAVDKKVYLCKNDSNDKIYIGKEKELCLEQNRFFDKKLFLFAIDVFDFPRIYSRHTAFFTDDSLENTLVIMPIKYC